MDPTENGSYNSCLVCKTCSSSTEDSNLMLPRDCGRFWSCDSCGSSATLAEVKAHVARGNERVRRAQREMERAKIKRRLEKMENKPTEDECA